MSLRPPVVSALVVALAGAAVALGCAGAVESSRAEDRARRTVPVPICLKALERHSGANAVSVMKPEDYWSLLLPGFDAGSSSVDRSSPDCSGRPVFDRPELADAEGTRSGALPVQADDAIVTPGPDGLRILWLKTHRFADGTAAGPIALARPREGFAEVYATGFYRGREKDSRFAVERMGARFVVTAGDEGCRGVKPGRTCESGFNVMVMASGRLLPSAEFALEHVGYGTLPGVPGAVEYRLTATPVFQKDALRVVEQLTVRDENQGVIRKSDLERVFRIDSRGELKTKQASLWDQVAGSVTAGDAAPEPEPEPEDVPPPKGKTTRPR